jgi:hypothetical protein
MLSAALRVKLLTSRLVTVVGIHLALDLALTRYGWLWDQQMLLVALGILLSQLALLTIWAVVVATAPLVRFAVPTIGTVGCWYLQSLILPWGVGEEATAAWALALVIQVFTIFVACESYRLKRCFRAAQDTKPGDIELANPLRYGLGTLMLWTTVVGLAFGFIQFGRHYWQWTTAVFEWEYLAAIPIIGVINGLVAAMCLWVFASSGLAWLFVRMLTAVMVAGGLAVFQSYSTEWITGTSVITMKDSLIVVAVQSFIISVSLAVATQSGPGLEATALQNVHRGKKNWL